jgi:hypothetical protein
MVRFLTTVHNATPESENFENRYRRRPQITPANRQLIDQGWGDNVTRCFPLPRVSVDYNDFMGEVDIADQRRSYYPTHLRVCRNWLPLFFWLLDTAIINSFLIAVEATSGPQYKEEYWSHHGSFHT